MSNHIRDKITALWSVVGSFSPTEQLDARLGTP
jgi:hypothetical protein